MPTLQLALGTEAKLLNHARARGLNIEQYLTSLVDDLDGEEQAIQEGLDELAAGRVRPLRDFLDEFRERRALPH